MKTLSDDTIGLIPIFTSENSWLRLLEIYRLRLDMTKFPSFSTYVSEHTETCLYVLTGSCTAQVRGSWGKRTISSLGGRSNLFTELPNAIAVSPKSELIVTASSRYFDSVFVIGHSDLKESQPSVLRDEDIQVHHIGSSCHKRIVREVIGGNGITKNIRAGETINDIGGWSSWPPHTFDYDKSLAKSFEEVFIYFVHPRDGYGIQVLGGVFSNLKEVNESRIFRNGESCIMPLGRHPIVAAPDSQIMYVWFYISPIPKRYAKWADDCGKYL